MSDGPVFVERIDYEAARGMASAIAAFAISEASIKAIIDAALVGVRPAKVDKRGEFRSTENPAVREFVTTQRRFHTDWEEVEE